MIKTICLFALLAVAFAQYVPQTGPFTVTPVTAGVVTAGSLLATTESDNYHVQLYSFWVPENVTSVNVTFVDLTTTQCEYIDLYLSTYGLPCSSDEYDSEYQCASAYNIDDGISTYTTIFDASTTDYHFQYQVNQYWYFAVGRYFSSDYVSTCNYNLLVNYASSCPAGSVGVQYGSTITCETYTTANTSATYNLVNANPAGTNEYTVYKFPVLANNVGHIYLTINSTSSDLEVVGRNYAAASYDTDYNCYINGYSVQIGNYYIYQLFCYTPRLGDFFFTIDTTDANWNATLNFNTLTCGAALAGANCSFPLYQFNASLLVAPQNILIPAAGDSDVSYGSVYFYYDIPANYTAGNVVLFANSAQSGYLITRRNGFPTANSESGYEYDSEYSSFDGILALNQFDYATAGRIYFALICDSYTVGCNVTISLNQSAVTTSAEVTTAMPMPTPTTGLRVTTAMPMPTPTTGLRVTTGITTQSVATTGNAASASSAGVIVPSVIAVAAALFAMF